MLSNKDIQHIAQLARITIAEKDEEKLKEELSSILDYINKLNEVNTEGIAPLYQTTELVNSIRPDEYRKDFVMDEELNKKLIGQAPKKEERFIKVRSVLNK